MKISIWDDPFGDDSKEDKEKIIIPSRGIQEIDLFKIKKRQKKLIPYIEQLKKSAEEILRRYDPSFLLLSEKELLTVVEYRIPVAPHLLQRFTHSLTDFSVLVPVFDERPNSMLDRFAYPRKISEIKGYGNLSELFRLERIGFDSIPDRVRIVYPNLMNFIVFWVRELDGPINSVKAIERPVHRSYGHVTVASFRH